MNGWVAAWWVLVAWFVAAHVLDSGFMAFSGTFASVALGLMHLASA